MYPINSASPLRIAIGAVIQIADGAVQLSGVSVVVRAEGGSETAGGGTVSYGATSGVVYYVPTQAETNYTAFVVTAYKTGCIPISVTVVTTASTVAGNTVLAASQPNYAPNKVAPATPSNVSDVTAAVAASVTAVTAAVAISQAAITSLLPAVLIDGKIDASVGSLAADAVSAASVSAAAVAKIQAGLALAATALSTATWTPTLAGYIDVAISSRTATGQALDSAIIQAAAAAAVLTYDPPTRAESAADKAEILAAITKAKLRDAFGGRWTIGANYANVIITDQS